MTYTDRPAGLADPATYGTADYHDRVRWGPIIAGLFVAISTQLVLTGIGAAIGATTLASSDAPRSNANEVGTAVGIWSIISLFVSLFLGSWMMSRSCGPMNRSTALLNGAILWATTLALSSWLLASGVSGAFGILASNAGEIADQVVPGGADNIPNVVPSPTAPTAEQARDIAGNTARAGWSFAFGALLGLVSSLIGAAVGAKQPRNSYVEPSLPR